MREPRICKMNFVYESKHFSKGREMSTRMSRDVRKTGEIWGTYHSATRSYKGQQKQEHSIELKGVKLKLCKREGVSPLQ